MSLRHAPAWLLSLLLILALHVGLGYWAWFWRAPLPPTELPPAAVMIELAPLPQVAPPPPPQPVVRAPEPKLVEAPKPRLAIYKPKPQPPRLERQPAPKVEPPPLARPTPAAAPKAAQVAPPSPPSQAVPTWQSALFSHLSRYKRYPEAAKRREREGQRICKVRFTLDARGRVLEYAIVGPSGNRLLDQATREMIRRAQPLPPPPSELLSNGRLEIVAPIVYELRRS